MEPMPDFEKLGLFYLGKTYDLKHHKVTSDLLLYESKHLTTHAVCVGMTGSGKTGLGIGLLEEAAIDGIPVIAIDPKGDLGNLLLGFPELRPEDFLPWIDADEAGRAGLTAEQFAAQDGRAMEGRACCNGVRMAHGLRGCETQSIWRFTPRAVAPGCRSPYCARSMHHRRS